MSLAPMTPGDLIFVRQNDWSGQLIAQETRGPYSHVQIVVSATAVIEALPRGITRTSLTSDTLPAPADVAPTGRRLAVDRRAHALGWLASQVGQGYGWLDLLGDVVGILLPPQLGGRTPLLVAPSRYDCSDLATRFLVLAGHKWLPDALAMDPARVSPNDLARATGVLKS